MSVVEITKIGIIIIAMKEYSLRMKVGVLKKLAFILELEDVRRK